MTNREYNAYGQVTKLTEPGAQPQHTTYSFNGYGELLERVIPNGRKDTMTYDEYGLLAGHKIHASINGQPAQVVQELDYTCPELPGTGYQTHVAWVDSPIGANAPSLIHTYDTYGRLLKTQAHALKQAQLLGLAANQHKVVEATYGYDAADRMTSMRHDVVQNGSVLSSHETSYTFAASQGAWSTTTHYDTPGEFSIQAHEDGLGRIKTLTMAGTGVGATVKWPAAVNLHWASNLYAGRSQSYAYQGTLAVDPMVETRQLDGRGRLKRLDYQAVALDPATHQPSSSNMPWANEYCLGAWGSECEKPLWQVDIKRDVMGRIASMTQKMRQPVWHDASQTQRRAEPDRRHTWRGFGYNDRGFLTKEYVSDQDQTVAHGNIVGTVFESQLEGIIANTGAPGARWNWEREHGAGDLQSIHNDDDTTQVRWQHRNDSHPVAYDLRDAGHQLASVEIEGQGAQPITHDGQGRITQDMHFEYAWDAHDRLVATKPIGATAWAEVMLYDAEGRLIQREAPSQSQLTRFVYDRQQKVAAFDAQGVLQWRAVWGPGLDQLLWWHDAINDESYTVMDDGRKSVIGLWKDQSAKMALTREFDLQGRITQWDVQTEALECQEQLSSQRCPAQPGVGGAGFDFGWHTAWQSPLTGLVQMRQRWYSPTLGQFLSQDPLEYIDSQNMYAFGAYNPRGSMGSLGP